MRKDAEMGGGEETWAFFKAAVASSLQMHSQMWLFPGTLVGLEKRCRNRREERNCGTQLELLKAATSLL